VREPLCDALTSAAPRIAVAGVSLAYIARLEIGRHNRASVRSAHWRRRSRWRRRSCWS